MLCPSPDELYRAAKRCHPNHNERPDLAVAMHLSVGEEGHFEWKPRCKFDRYDEYPDGRYVGLSLVGSGTFGKVVECLDKKYKARVAIKVVRKLVAYQSAAEREIFILNDLNGLKNTPKLLREFHQDGHICMVFNLYGQSLKSLVQIWWVILVIF